MLLIVNIKFITLDLKTSKRSSMKNDLTNETFFVDPITGGARNLMPQGLGTKFNQDYEF